MSAAISVHKSEFKFNGTAATRNLPEEEWKHRLNTRAHLAYLHDEKLFDVSNSEWAKATVNGEVVYGHEFEGGLFTVRLKTSDGALNLTHNEDGGLDFHLMDNPGQSVVYSLTSSNNGLESTHTFTAASAGLTSVAIICACLTLTVCLASAMAAADAAIAAGAAVATFLGINTTVFPGVGIAIAVLALIGLWLAYVLGREIVLNITYENRSKQKITLIDHYVYNIGDNALLPATLKPLHTDGPFEFYDDVLVCIDNYSKYRGIGVSMKFQKDDGSFLVICIRNDIYKWPHYSILAFAKGDKTSAYDVYNNCTGDLVTKDFPWGSNLVVKNRIDPQGFNSYNFAGLLTFHDPS